MTTAELNQKFQKTIQTWQDGIRSYSSEHFSAKPAEDKWSAGQVCQHLISSTKRVFIVIEKCLAGNHNEHEIKTDKGERAFATDVLSEEKVKLPLSVQATPDQPESTSFVLNAFEELKKEYHALAEKVSQSTSRGKEKHPVLGFMNAKEWLQTTEMHFRHHLKQKNEIDLFLKTRGAN